MKRQANVIKNCRCLYNSCGQCYCSNDEARTVCIREVFEEILSYFMPSVYCFILVLACVAWTRADTVDWHERGADFAPTGSFQVPLGHENFFQGHPHNIWVRDKKLFALNAPDETGTSRTPDTPAEPEQMTFGAWLWDYLYNGASITVGVGTRQAELKVTEKITGKFGKIVQRDEEAYFLSYSTRESFIRDTHFGYTFMLNYTTFNMDKQEVEKNVYEDIGTRLRGKVAYVVPTLFYQWGEHRKIGKFVRTGIGIGLGVAKFEGNITLTNPAPYPPPIPIANGSYDLKFAASAFLEARYRHWGLKFSVAGPSYQDEKYIYNLSDIAVNLGYSYYF